jgi:hypothetical protein
VADELAEVDAGDRTDRLVGDTRDRAAAELSRRVDLSPEPRAEAYDDPFGLSGMEEE